MWIFFKSTQVISLVSVSLIQRSNARNKKKPFLSHSQKFVDIYRQNYFFRSENPRTAPSFSAGNTISGIQTRGIDKEQIRSAYYFPPQHFITKKRRRLRRTFSRETHHNLSVRKNTYSVSNDNIKPNSWNYQPFISENRFEGRAEGS